MEIQSITFALDKPQCSSLETSNLVLIIVLIFIVVLVLTLILVLLHKEKPFGLELVMETQ